MNNQELLEQILYGSTKEQAIPLMLENAAFSWTAQAAIIQQKITQIVVSGGMGLSDDAIVFRDSQDMEKFNQYFGSAAQSHPQRWNGLYTGFIRGVEEYFSPLDVFAALWAGKKMLTQPLFDFLMARDLDYRTGCYVHLTKQDIDVRTEIPNLRADTLREYFAYSQDEFALARAFHDQMIAEANPTRHRVLTGVFVMDRTPFKIVDETILYDSLRMVFTAKGIFASVLNDKQQTVAPIYWTPEGINTAQVWFHPRSCFAIDVMLSCIWRDACVVKEQWSERGNKRGYSSGGSVSNPALSAITLPRRVYRSTWGISQERETMEKLARNAHKVRHSYPLLSEGMIAHDAAERAEEWFLPAPPPGRTFRKPHVRGEGKPEPETQARVVRCKGLQVAHLLLG